MVRRRTDTMAENRAKLLFAGRKAFADLGYAAASMDELTASVGLTRGALYSAFGDKRGLLAAVVEEMDTAMAARAHEAGERAGGGWPGLLAEGGAYIRMALEPDVQRIVLLDGPAVLGDPSRWPSQTSCLAETRRGIEEMIAAGIFRPVDPVAATRLVCGAALNAALYVAASERPEAVLANAVEAFEVMATGFRIDPPMKRAASSGRQYSAGA